MSEIDSMWLQNSITVPDPIPEEQERVVQPLPPPTSTPSTPDAVAPPPSKEDSTMPPPSQPTERKANTSEEMDLTKMALDTTSFLRNTSVQRASVRYPSRSSVTNSAFITAHEYDDLRARYSQAKRELLKLSDIQKDLDFSRFELNRAQEETKALMESHHALKAELEDTAQRLEKEHKMRLSLEAKTSTDDASRSEEVSFLKQTIEELREENARRLDDMTAQQESEFQGRLQSMRDELSSAAEEAERLVGEVTKAQKGWEAAEVKLSAVNAELDRIRGEVADARAKAESMQAQCRQLEQQHREFVAQQEKSRTTDMDAQRSLNEERMQQVTRVKDALLAELQEEVRVWKGKHKAAAEELAATRHSLSEAQEEVKQLGADRTKELRRLAEEHRLALCEKQLQLEAAVRDAKGSKTSVEEEAHSLRRQLAQVSSELSTVAGVLAQRERQLAQMEEEVSSAKERCMTLEQENSELAADAQANNDAAAEAEGRVERLIQQKDELEEEFTKDLRAAKDRIRSLEAALMQSRSEHSVLRKEQIRSSDTGLATTRDLRAQVEALSEECGALRAATSEQRRAEDSAQEYRKRYEQERTKAAALEVELSVAVHRCGTLEAKVEEHARRAISHAVSRSPMQSIHANIGVMTLSGKQRSNSSVHSTSPGSGSLKRARTEDARVFAISGFDGNAILLAAKELPNVAIAESKSNMPVPANLTHLISNGQVTIKLLTALVRGCWVLPESYVMDSLKEQRWLREEDYGFRHENPPLLKKRVAMTEAFTSCKMFSTASVLLKEGGAISVANAGEADILLCTYAEARTLEEAWTWERFSEMINPLKIS